MTKKINCIIFRKVETKNDVSYQWLGQKRVILGTEEFKFKKHSFRIQLKQKPRFWDKKGNPTYYYDYELLEPISDIQSSDYYNPSSLDWYNVHENKTVEQIIRGATAKAKEQIPYMWIVVAVMAGVMGYFAGKGGL